MGEVPTNVAVEVSVGLAVRVLAGVREPVGVGVGVEVGVFDGKQVLVLVAVGVFVRVNVGFKATKVCTGPGKLGLDGVTEQERVKHTAAAPTAKNNENVKNCFMLQPFSSRRQLTALLKTTFY